jgi:quinol monooxygenase YgiN
MDEAVQALRLLVGPVRAEPGCTATRLLKDVNDEGVVTFEEEWRGREDLERHLQAKPFRRVLAVMELAAGPPVVEIDEVSSRRGFDLVEEVLSRTVAAEAGAGMGSQR